METYDQAKIGKCISWIGDHIVYEYGADSVIKFSKSDFLLGSSKKSINDYEKSRAFFGEYILETLFVRSVNGRYGAAIQKKIFGRYLCLADMANIEIRMQCKDILEAYEKMKNSGAGEIDLIGYGGVFRPCFSNIFINADNKIILIESSIMEVRGHHFNLLRYIFLFLISPIALTVQHRTVKKFRALI